MSMSRKNFAICLLCGILLLCSCTPNATQAPDVPIGKDAVGGSSALIEQTEPTNEVDLSFAQTDDMFTSRDLRSSYEDAILIECNGTSAACASEGVSISGTRITITADGTYLLRGELQGGIVMVNAPSSAKPHIVLDGVSICSSGAALCVLGGDKIVLTLAPGSENTLSSEGRFTEIGGENVDGTLYSKQDLTLNGSGALTITGAQGHGIVGKDDVVLAGGTIAITAHEHGIDANDSVRLTGVTLSLVAGKDGIHVENKDDSSRGFFYMENGTVSATAEGDGIDASAYLQMDDGVLSLTTGGGAKTPTKNSSFGGFGGFGGRGGASSSSSSQNTTSTKGLKAAGTVWIRSGTLSINSADDAIHSNTSAVIEGGTLTLQTGDDAIHADEYLTISGGEITVKQSYEGLEAQDIEICGGEITLICTDDGINAAGGADESGFGGMGGGDRFGAPGGHGGPGGMGAGNGSVLISGGSLYINASGDGIDANGTLRITGGLTTVCGPTQGDTAVLDYDKTGEISGGTFIGTGSQMMAQSFSSSEQGVIAVSVGTQAAGTQITLTDAQGKELLSYQPAESFQIVMISTPELVKGASYTIAIGEESAAFDAR